MGAAEEAAYEAAVAAEDAPWEAADAPLLRTRDCHCTRGVPCSRPVITNGEQGDADECMC